MNDIGEQIEQANRQAIDILRKGRPMWIGFKPAIEVIPGMTKTTILHAGPPIEWERMCTPMRQGIIGGLLFEGLASIREEAEALVESGKITLSPCHEYNAVGGMTGITTASMPVHIVRNDTYGNLAFGAAHSGYWRKALHWGTYDNETLEHTRWVAEVLGPVIDNGLRAMGGLDVRNLIARAVQMGDECHTRNVAATSLIVTQMVPHLVLAGIPPQQLSEVLAWLRDSDTFALHVIMASSKSLLEPAKDIEYSTVVTTMSRNGVEFGIKVSALGEQWFTGPAGRIRTIFFSPEWKDEDAAPDIGDSSLVETIGLGGMIHAAAPAQELLYRGCFNDALAKTESAYSITIAEHDAWLIPTLDLRGVPLGIDIRKVLKTGFTPIIDTATAHREGGKVGVGEARAPIEAFEKALRAFASKYGM